MARADSRKVSCGVTVFSPAGAPGAPAARGAERFERAAEGRAPARRPAGLRVGALRRADFFEVFFLAMESSPGLASETTAGARRQRDSTICRLQLTRRPESCSRAPQRPSRPAPG